MTWRANLQHNLSRMEDELRVVSDIDGKRFEAVSITFEERPMGSVLSDEGLVSDHDAVGFVQAVMDAGYAYGLRPSAVQDEKHIKAHLEDMRQISRHLLKMDK